MYACSALDRAARMTFEVHLENSIGDRKGAKAAACDSIREFGVGARGCGQNGG